MLLLGVRGSVSRMTLRHSSNFDSLRLALEPPPPPPPPSPPLQQRPLTYLAARTGVATDQQGIKLQSVRWFHETRGGGALATGAALNIPLGTEAMSNATTSTARSYVIQLRTRDWAAAAASRMTFPTGTLVASPSRTPVQRQFLSRLGELYKKGHNCDVTVECADGKSIPFYKIVLTTHSDVFEVRQ